MPDSETGPGKAVCSGGPGRDSGGQHPGSTGRHFVSGEQS